MTVSEGLLGRDGELAQLQRLLSRPGGRLVTVTGPPGVGKTTLARAFAQAESDAGLAATVVELGGADDPARVPTEIAHGLGIDSRGVAQRPERLARAVGDARLLLVLDDCDRVLAAGPDLVALLRACLRLTVLATSRERFRVPGERELAIPPLPSPDRIDDRHPDRIGANPAVRLFAARAAAADPGFELTAENAAAVAEVCRGLDGLPLAIELAAARVRQFSPAEIAARLHRRMTLLVAGPRDSTPRHRSLRASLEWSLDLLPEEERAVFRRLSVFGAAADLAAVERVCGGPDVDVPRVLDSLVDKSLVLHHQGAPGPETRYGMLESLRELGWEGLGLVGEQDLVRSRLADHLAELSMLGEHSVGTRDEPVWLDWLSEVAPDLRRALAHAHACGQQGSVPSWLAVSLAWFCHVRGRQGEGAQLLHEHLVGAADRDDDATTAVALAGGVLAFDCGENEVALQLLTLARGRSESQGRRRRTAVCLSFLGHVHRQVGDHAAASAAYRQAMTGYEEDGNDWGSAWSRHDLGMLARARGDLEEADRLLAESLDWFRGVDHAWAGAWAAWGLGAVRADSGAEDALGLLLDALRAHQELQDLRGVAQGLESVATLAETDDPGTAARLLGAADTLTERVGVSGDAAAPRLRPTTAIRAALGDRTADREWAAGRALPMTEAVALARSVRPRHPPAGAAAGLTPREREVAAYVATGCTNRAIGRALGISDKTVETHLQHVRDKLDLPGRAALAAWSVANGLAAPDR